MKDKYTKVIRTKILISCLLISFSCTSIEKGIDKSYKMHGYVDFVEIYVETSYKNTRITIREKSRIILSASICEESDDVSMQFYHTSAMYTRSSEGKLIVLGGDYNDDPFDESNMGKVYFALIRESPYKYRHLTKQELQKIGVF